MALVDQTPTTVGELREALEDFGDHVPVVLVAAGGLHTDVVVEDDIPASGKVLLRSSDDD